MTSESILVVAAHPDDEVLGCGGTIAAHAARGDRVHIAVMATGLASRGPALPHDFARLHDAAHRAQNLLGAESLVLLEFPDNRMDTVALLDVVKAVERLIDRYQPQTIYTHSGVDLNIDHRRTHQAVVTACRPVAGHPTRSLLCFEIPSSTEWMPPDAGQAFAPNWFNSIEATLATKLAALACYEGEVRPFPHPRSLQAVANLAAWRGSSCGYRAAEAFVVARQINLF